MDWRSPKTILIRADWCCIRGPVPCNRQVPLTGIQSTARAAPPEILTVSLRETSGWSGGGKAVTYWIPLKNRCNRGRNQCARSSENATAIAFPTIRRRSIMPMKRLSLLLSRLSPITK